MHKVLLGLQIHWSVLSNMCGCVYEGVKEGILLSKYLLKQIDYTPKLGIEIQNPKLASSLFQSLANFHQDSFLKVSLHV